MVPTNQSTVTERIWTNERSPLCLEEPVHQPGRPVVLGLDVANPDRQEVPAPVQGHHAAALLEGVREDVFVNEAESLQTQRSRDWLCGEEMSPQEVHHILIHLRGDHLELNPLLLEHGGGHDVSSVLLTACLVIVSLTLL